MLEVNHICKTFDAVPVLQDVTFQAGGSEICGILGKNGAGKTTLFKIVSNLLLQDSGEILLDGAPLHSTDFYSVFGVERSLYWTISVYENILYYSALKNIDKREVDEKLKNCQELQFIHPFLKRKTGKLSLGEKQLVLITILMIVNPKLMCLDEPSNGLDILNLKHLEQLLLNCSRKNQSIILVSSHDVSFLYDIADVFFVVDNGKIVAKIDKAEKDLETIEKMYQQLIIQDV